MSTYTLAFTSSCLRAVRYGLFLFLSFAATSAIAQQESTADQDFIELLASNSEDANAAFERIQTDWQPSYVPMALDILSLAWDRATRNKLINIMEQETGQEFGANTNEWYRWIWNQDEQRHPNYARFKSNLYRLVDKKFAAYFSNDREDTIRLDEVRWGGVEQDSIPPLRQPKMLTADKADYLADSDVVFGIEINGDARAYPKRILAWHEMFVDEVGGNAYAGVYCTLCGALILYETTHNEVNHEIGTSGFLYRSNKLMYDKKTQSLWSTTRGEPVIGPLVGKGIRLQRSFVVTTTWGEWKRRHPETQVLSLDTGHQRNYDEGVAYQDYFSSDRLMFNVPKTDSRLKNKDEILALTFPELTDVKLAIHETFLRKNPIYTSKLGAQKFVVLTDKSGANRVFETGQVAFKEYDQLDTAIDSDGQVWTLSEAHLSAADGTKLARLPAHRAFWFGWFAAHNDTRLVY